MLPEKLATIIALAPRFCWSQSFKTSKRISSVGVPTLLIRYE